MKQKEDENLEDFVEIFLYILQNNKHVGLNEETTRTLFLRLVRDEYVDILNLMDSRDVYQLPLSEIHEHCRKYSRSRSKVGKGVHDPLIRVTK